MWIVLLEGTRTYDTPEAFGPFENEDECYRFAARVSQEPNDWTPLEVKEPASVV
jgi:hypothetical protein